MFFRRKRCAAPFAGAVYGFTTERLKYRVRRIEIPITNLPPAMDGMKIAQISDIHLSAFMNRAAVRRAVDMTNDLGSDLTVVTGDLITNSQDPIADCVEEVSRLHAPLGVWGCNGNHEIYADAEDRAQPPDARIESDSGDDRIDIAQHAGRLVGHPDGSRRAIPGGGHGVLNRLQGIERGPIAHSLSLGREIQRLLI